MDDHAVGPAASGSRRWWPLLVGSAGAALLLAALTADLLRGGALADFGLAQLAAAVIGLTMIGVVIVAGVPRGTVYRTRAGDVWLDRDAVVVQAWPFALVLLQVVGLVLVMQAFRIENRSLYGRLAPLIAIGFVAHHVMPRGRRLAVFLALSLAGIVLVFGPRHGATLIVVGLLLVAACHLPIAFGARVAVVVALGAVLALMRVSRIPTPFAAAIWPVLGSMFMFRLIAYLYDLKHQKEPVQWARTLSYFFLMPNVTFPLFPVIDFNTFKRTYYDRPALEIYQQGVHWMARGLTHLLAYRLVYQYATISPAEVTNTLDLVRYMLANFGLYLRVSGQFHLVVGILHLFGFRLPETHRFFYLASSFTDFWRRINIYWKDFMQKLVFNPVYLPLRRRLGDTGALVGATLLVFLTTWLLHSYQWFWLLGTWLWSTTDTLFWGLLAVLLVVSSLHEMTRGRTRTPVGATGAAPGGWRLAAGTAATFIVICVLWSLWTSPTLRDWLAMLGTATWRPVDVAVLMAVPLVIGTGAVAASRLSPARRLGPAPVLALLALPLTIVTLAARPGVAERLPVVVDDVLRRLRTGELNRRDLAELQRGYYERIVGVNRFNGQLWEVYSKRPPIADLTEEAWNSGALRRRTDILQQELRPNIAIAFVGHLFTTNAWGMRDKDYTLARPAGVHRTAVLGASPVMGHGVGDGETYEAVVEDRLNREAGPGGRRYEWLNFAAWGYSSLSQLFLLENGRAFGFEPDVILYVANERDIRVTEYLFDAARKGHTIPWEWMRETMRRADVAPGTARSVAVRRLQPFAPAMLERVYRAIVDRCRERGVTPVWMLPPFLDDIVPPQDVALLPDIARKAGFVVLDFHDVFAGYEKADLVVAEWDLHHNARAHRLIADRLLEQLHARPELLGLAAR